MLFDKAKRVDSTLTSHVLNELIFAQDTLGMLDSLKARRNGIVKCNNIEMIEGNYGINIIYNRYKNDWTNSKKINSVWKNSLETSTIVNEKSSDTLNHTFFQLLRKKGRSKILNNLLVYVPNDNYRFNTVCNIRRGASVSQLVDTYGPYSNTIEIPRGSLLTYELKSTQENDNTVHNGIIFIVKEGQVENWLIYKRLRNNQN